MADLIFDKFHRGLVTHPSETELSPGAALKAEDVNFDAIGKLKSRKGYKLEFAGPTGITLIGDPFKYEFNLPGSFGRKEVILVYGQDGSSRDTLWWRPYWDAITAAWIDAWQELTEFEGPYTAAAGTTIGRIEATLGELDNEGTTNYYRYFTMLNINRQTTIEINSYASSTRRLFHDTDITGQVSGDTYFLYRFPLFMHLEGPYTIDSSSADTDTVDTELRGDLDDYYNGWTVVNTSRSGLAGLVSDYDATKKKLTHASIAGHVGGDTYYIYDNNHNIRANGNPVRFFTRQNSIEISLGNDEGYPLKAPIWFGFIRQQFWFDDANNLQNFEGFQMTWNVLEKPDSSAIVFVDSGGGTLADDAYYCKISYVYDGYQESPLSDSVVVNPAGAQAIDMSAVIPLDRSDPTRKPSVFGATFNRRIRSVRFYVAKGVTGDAKDDYFLLYERGISSLVIGEQDPGVVFWSQSTFYWAFPSPLVVDDDLWNGVTYFTNIGVVLGKQLRWDHNQGHKSKSVDANFKFRATLEEQHYKAPIFTDEQRDAFVGYSVQDNGNGVPIDDIIPHENFINLDQKGIIEITGLSTIRGFLIILTPNKIFIYAPERSLTDFPVERGGIAERGFISMLLRKFSSFLAADFINEE